MATGLDEMRVSLDAADAASYAQVRGKDFFDRIVRDVGELHRLQREIGATQPQVSLWLTGLKETIAQLPEFVRLAARMGVHEVHLQRLVFDDVGYGLARAESSLFETDARRGAGGDRRGAGAGTRARRDAGCVRRDRAGPQPATRRARTGRGRPAGGPGR